MIFIASFFYPTNHHYRQLIRDTEIRGNNFIHADLKNYCNITQNKICKIV